MRHPIRYTIRSVGLSRKVSGFQPLSFGVVLCILLLAACGASEENESDPSSGAEPAGDPVSEGDKIYLIDENGEVPEAEWEARHASEIRGRMVRINPELFRPGALVQGGSLVMNLFDDTTYEAEITRVRDGYAGVKSVAGRLAAEENALFTFSLEEGERMLATIRLPQADKTYRIYYSGEAGHHTVVQIDPEKADVVPEHPPLIPPDTLNNG